MSTTSNEETAQENAEPSGLAEAAQPSRAHDEWVFPSERDPDWTVPRAFREVASQCPSGHEDAGFTFLRPDRSRDHMSFPELLAEVQRRAALLLESGLEQGDRVALVIPEPDEFILSFLACLDCGLVAVPMYPPLSFGKLDAYVDSTARVLERSGARVLLTSKKVQTVLWSLVDRVGSLERLDTVESFFDAGRRPTHLDYTLSRPDDIAFLQFTSGSTAAPKGVIVTHRSLGANIWGIMVHGLLIDPPNDVAVSWLPLYHDMGLIGLMLCPLTWGVRTVFLDTVSFVKHPRRWMKACSDFDGTLTFAPNFAYALAARRTKPRHIEELDLSSLRVIGCGAEPNHPATLRRFVDHFAPAGLEPNALLPVYGMAEATLAMTFSRLDDEVRVDRVEPDPYTEDGHARSLDGWPREMTIDAHDEGSESPSPDATSNAADASNGDDASAETHYLEYVTCGRPFPEHEILIVDDDGNELPERSVGEIVFRGPSVTAGYYRDGAATAAAYTDKGLHTGDLGYLVDGELFVTGRKKDVVILNGRNYDPQTIEWLVADVEGVRKGNVVAFSVPDTKTERLVVVAEVKSDADRDAIDDVARKRVQEELFLRIDDIVLVDRGALPKTTSGKLQRSRTQAQYVDGELGRDGVRTVGEKGQAATVIRHVTKSAVSRVRHEVKSRVSSLIGVLRR